MTGTNLSGKAGLSDAERRVVDHLAGTRDAMVRDLAELVAMSSHTPDRAGVSKVTRALSTRLERLGATTRVLAGDPTPPWLREGPRGPGASEADVQPANLVVCSRAGAGLRLLLCGHTDTVHARDASFGSLVVDPANPSRAIGPGCADMKGGLLVAVVALEALHALGMPPHWTFAIVEDEETGSFGTDRALRAEAGSGGYACGLIFEPALPDGGLVTQRPGSAQFVIECTGRSAHVGRDFAKGISAVGALAEAVGSALRLADPSRGILVNVGPLEGGAATNIIPDRARAWGNLRCVNEVAFGAAREGLEALCTNHGRLPTTRVEVVVNRPPKPATPGVMKLAEEARRVSEALGMPLPFGETGGVCDGNNIQAAGVPTIDTLGVRGGGLHTRDEWIDLESLVPRAQLAAVLMLRLSGQRDGGGVW